MKYLDMVLEAMDILYLLGDMMQKKMVLFYTVVSRLKSLTRIMAQFLLSF